ncbi:uncharacterized protein LOC130290873 isoform X2 [Hyla sarda]|uniref:uncharacterized protein LOC130290873 isoform X2 n=1 Tax=Hyla sarda TaxID=327740 RepID=UPI0024C26B88|nr:uncharacterized protein LOC130290873 isoform X2 [Hyla sarda]
MAALKTTLSLLLVASFHLQLIYSAPTASPAPSKVPLTSAVSHASTAKAPTNTGGHAVSSTTLGHGTATGVKSTGSPRVITSGATAHTTARPSNTSSGGATAHTTVRPSNTSSGSVNGSHVSGATPAVTPKANAQTSAVTGSHSNVSASTGKVNTSSKPATSNSQPHASSGNRPSVVSGLLVNPCPNQCPNGIGGNPPCVCAVPLV